MKTQPNPLPQGQGIYCLVHRPTRSLYVGSSTNLRGRAYEWRAALKRGCFQYPADEWEFSVVERTEGMSYNELRKLEIKRIEQARAKGLRLLNRQTPAAMMRFVVDGLEGSATFHACRLGKNPSKIIEKLRRGDTIEQALGRATRHYDPRDHAVALMPIKLTHQGKPLTYAEAAEVTGRSSNALKGYVRRVRLRSPETKEFSLENITTTPTPA